MEEENHEYPSCCSSLKEYQEKHEIILRTRESYEPTCFFFNNLTAGKITLLEKNGINIQAEKDESTKDAADSPFSKETLVFLEAYLKAGIVLKKPTQTTAKPYEPPNRVQCKTCHKKMTPNGLKYHLYNQVCQKPKK